MAAVNYSIYAIPVYMALTLIPHQYAIAIIKSANNGRWNNANPRSSAWNEIIQKSVPAEIFGRYERAEGAHKNGLENLPVFATAVVLGNMAKLPARTLNTVAGLYLALRAIYNVVYIRTSTNKASFLRTAIYTVSVILCFYQIILAANVFASRDEK